MKSNFWIWAVLLFLGSQYTFAQFNFKQHKVVPGDDVYSIAKEYGTTPEAIYELNPMAREGIQPDTVIVLPNIVTPPEKRVEGITFKRHKTRSKETLYSVARKYKVSVDAIKEYNTFLENDPLRKGDILQIPLPAPKTNKVVRRLGKNKDKFKPKDSIVLGAQTKIYTIQPKDTRYGVARKFGLTIPELENMNPNLGDTFPIGLQILVAKDEAILNAPQDPNDTTFELYEVQPKETLYSLGKRYKIPLDSIDVLNPYVKEQGLKAGMILKLPNLFGTVTLPGEEPMVVNLENNLVNYEQHKIAILLPFNLNKVNLSDEEAVEKHLSDKAVNLSADFYSGALLAVDKAKQKGISSLVEVCDTQKSDKTIQDFIKRKKIEDFDAVIGPLFQKNVEKAAAQLNKSGTPVMSPISSKVKADINNLYQSRPTDAVLQDKIIAYVKKDSLPKNIIIIADEDSPKVKEKLMTSFTNAKALTPEENNFIKESELNKVLESLDKKLPTVVFLETKSIPLISNVVPFLNAKVSEYKITLYTTDKSMAYDSESILNLHLANLNFHYPSVINEATNSIKRNFIKTYKNKYGMSPNSYAIRGFDMTYDVLLRLAAKDNRDPLANLNYVTEYVENKFYYTPNSDGGFVNRACYVLNYKKGLQIELAP